MCLQKVSDFQSFDLVRSKCTKINSTAHTKLYVVNMDTDEDILDLTLTDREISMFNSEFGDLIPKHNFVYLDMQGFFAHNGQFILKEICFIGDNFKFHTLVKSPFSMYKLPAAEQSSIKYLTKNFHGLSYNDGGMHIIEVIQQLYPKFQNKIVMVRNQFKVNTLKHIFRMCGDIECVSIQDQGFNMHAHSFEMKVPCMYHRQSKKRAHYHCALAFTEELNEITLNNLKNRN